MSTEEKEKKILEKDHVRAMSARALKLIGEINKRLDILADMKRALPEVSYPPIQKEVDEYRNELKGLLLVLGGELNE